MCNVLYIKEFYVGEYSMVISTKQKFACIAIGASSILNLAPAVGQASSVGSYSVDRNNLQSDVRNVGSYIKAATKAKSIRGDYVRK